jgi:hypothetical protein
MNDIDISIHIFAAIDDIIKSIEIDPKPGLKGRLTESEILTLMVLHPVLRPFSKLEVFYRWINRNYNYLFPNMPDYTRIKRLFDNHKELIIVVMQKLANLNSFGLVADGTCVSVMETIRGKYAKTFRDARFVYSASKHEWYYGFILEAVIDQQGLIAFANVGTQAEVKQLENILDDLQDKWVLADDGNRGKEIHKRLWEEKQVKINLKGGKERQWIENVFGYLKEKLGLNKIRVRTTTAFLARAFSILCAYNLIITLNLPI